MGFKKQIEVDGGYTAEYWNMGKVADITRGSKNNGTVENPDMVKTEKADVYMRCFKDRASYIADVRPVKEQLFSVEYPYNQKVNREDIYNILKEQVEFFEDAEDVIE